MHSPETRNDALAQASIEHATYFLELEAYERAANYFAFAAQPLQSISQPLLEVSQMRRSTLSSEKELQNFQTQSTSLE